MSRKKTNLSDEQKRVLFDKGTETPGTGEYLNHDETGVYTCANCEAELFRSSAKYESTMPGLIGWPSFHQAANNKALKLLPDNSMGMKRTEVTCAQCGGHLGHLFEGDPSAPNGKHYCINSASLGFTPREET
ncbi:MAG: peptide-methionine (R)-S-oxide reductase MsrB [Candidatus Saccharibacteria bacterium]|nr:peptide-methionine (R)-S-oxide reductase MsrB [Candidatus Saccharibacteria bacterium]